MVVEAEEGLVPQVQLACLKQQELVELEQLAASQEHQ
jgi:hypothetical protein